LPANGALRGNGAPRVSGSASAGVAQPGEVLPTADQATQATPPGRRPDTGGAFAPPRRQTPTQTRENRAYPIDGGSRPIGRFDAGAYSGAYNPPETNLGTGRAPANRRAAAAPRASGRRNRVYPYYGGSRPIGRADGGARSTGDFDAAAAFRAIQRQSYGQAAARRNGGWYSQGGNSQAMPSGDVDTGSGPASAPMDRQPNQTNRSPAPSARLGDDDSAPRRPEAPRDGVDTSGGAPAQSARLGYDDSAPRQAGAGQAGAPRQPVAGGPVAGGPVASEPAAAPRQPVAAQPTAGAAPLGSAVTPRQPGVALRTAGIARLK